MNVILLLPLPPGVVTAIFPVFAPGGTVAVICVPPFTVKLAFTPPNFTCDAPTNPEPVIVTCLPTEPLGGAKLPTKGTTLNRRLLVSVPEGVVTVTKSAVPSAGTTVVMYVSETTLKVAEPEPNRTLDVPVNPLPRISTVCPAVPHMAWSMTNGGSPIFTLKTTPPLKAPPLSVTP